MHDILEIGRRQRKRQAIHETLLLSAKELFRERGIARTTMDDIAESADVARQTVYNHFPYKETFALELAAVGIQAIAQRAQALLEAGTPALDVLQSVSAWLMDLAIEDPEVAVVVARELLHSDAERAARAADHVPLQRIFEAILQQAQEEGGIREDLPLDVVSDRFSCIITSMVAQVPGSEISVLRRNLSISFDMLFHGITKRSA